MKFVNNFLRDWKNQSFFFLSFVLGIAGIFGSANAKDIVWQDAQGGKETRFVHKNVSYYAFSPRQAKQIALYWQDEAGKNYYSFRSVMKQAKKQGKNIVMLTNGAIYDQEFRPAGLWIEQGKLLKKVNRNKAKGNFHIEPAAVFYILGNQAKLVSLDTWEKQNIQADYALQAAPMLLIAGKINLRFRPKIYSPYSRNGLCTTRDNQVYFVITDTDKTPQDDLPNFYDFAESLQKLGCHQAVYLDGSISHLWSKNYSSLFHLRSFAGIIAVFDAD